MSKLGATPRFFGKVRFPVAKEVLTKKKLEELMAQGDVDDTPKAGSEFGKATWAMKEGGRLSLESLQERMFAGK